MTNPVSPTPIDALPPAPLVSDTPAQFDAKAFPFAAALDPLRTQINTQSLQTNQNAVAAVDAAAAAVPAAQAAVAAQDWMARRDLGAHATFPTLDNQGRPLIQGAQFLYTGVTPNAQYAWDGSQWIIGVNVTSGVTQLNGQAGALQLKTIGGEALLGSGNIDASALYRVIRTSDSQLIPGDKSKLIDITAGTFTQTFAAASTLGDGWFCYLRNSGAGDITLEPNVAEQIDGLTSYVMYPGECRLVQCDGATLRSIVLNAFYKTFTASGTFTKPPGYTRFEGFLWSAGGSGRKGATASNRLGGSGGACSYFLKPASSLSSTESVVIGAGGVSIAVNDTDGQSGGSSSFAGLTSPGGFGGANSTFRPGATAYAQTTGEALAANANHVFSGSDPAGPGYSSRAFYGGDSSRVSTNCPGSVYGGGGGGSIDTGGSVRTAGGSLFGGAGGPASASGNASDGSAPGGAGGAAVNGAGNSGAGARGELRIWGMI